MAIRPVILALIVAAIWGSWMYRYDTQDASEGYRYVTVITDRWTGRIERCQTFINGETVCRTVR